MNFNLTFVFLTMFVVYTTSQGFTNPDINRSSLRGTRCGKLPQFVVLTFDDAVNNELWEFLYKDFFNDLTDPYTQCQIKATFFVSHEHTDYTKVNALFNAGHEIALHSFSHGGNGPNAEQLAKKFRSDRWTLEVQMNIWNLINHAFLPRDMQFGWRAPFLYTAGDESFKALNRSDILYDSSLSFYKKSWPYHLSDSVKSSSCLIKPCPTGKDYIFYEAPLSVWRGIDGNVCAMMDACRLGYTKEQAFNVMMDNFQAFREQGVPLPISLHGGILINPGLQHVRKALTEFLHTVLKMKDVHFVTMRQLVEFTRTPKSSFQFARDAKRACSTFQPRLPCKPKRSACELEGIGTTSSTYLHTCAKRCPAKRLEIASDFFG